MTTTRRPAGRPRTRILDRAVITSTARQLVTEYGIDGFTMTHLASELGVTPSAVYNHAESKLEILRWIEDAIMSEVDTTAFGALPWRDALRVWARSYRDIMAANFGLITLIATTEVRDSPQTVRMYEQVSGVLVDAGWPLASVVPFVTALESFIYGNAMNEFAPETIFDVGEHRDEAPTFASAVAALPDRDQHEINNELFDLGFDAIVEWSAGRLGIE